MSIGVVLVTLAGAIAGFGEVRAGSQATEAEKLGQSLAVESMSTLLRTNQAAQVDVENFRRAQDLRAESGNALQQGLFADPALASALRLKQQRLRRAADAAQALTPLTLNSPDGPRGDPRFPSAFFAKRTADALRLQALQDAANQRRTEWDSRGSSYTAVLTLFAVVVYLFGFALAMPERLMRVFGTAGAFLLLVGVVVGLKTALSPPDRVPQQAAAEFTTGFVGLETSTDREGFLEAREHFSKAVDLWPGFGRGYVGRALATLRSESPKLNAVRLPTESLRSAERDLQRGRDLDLDTPSVRLQLAATKFALALQERPDLLRATEALARDAIAALADDPVPRYNLAFSLLAQGETEEAREAFEEALARTLAADARGTRRDPAFVQVIVSAALTDLDAIAAFKPALAQEVLRTKELVVGSAAAGRMIEPTDTTTFPPLQVLVTPSTLSWVASGAPDVDPATDVLSAQWYEQGSEGGWVGMPEISGRLDPRTNPAFPRQEARNILASSIPPRCLGSNGYKVELYVNGHLAGEGEIEASVRPLQAYVDRVLNLTMCYPAGWRLSPATLEGFRDVLVSPDGGQGAVMVRYNLSTLPERVRRLAPGAITASLLDTTVASLASVLPQVTARTPVTHQRFIWPDGASQRGYTLTGGRFALAQAGVDKGDDAAFVTLVFGPRRLFDQTAPVEQSLLLVATSFSEYRYGGGSS
ncbi:MAG: hypothetical protein ABR521_14795 [Gaiellaceae bacterium]